MALATVLLVGFMVLTFALLLVSVAGLDYRMALQQVDQARAFEAAHAALAQATVNLGADSTWGTHGESISGSLATDGSTWQVSFASSAGIGVSSNNLANPSTIAGWQGSAVPGRTAMIIAQGRGPGGAICVLRALFEAAAVPYALASTSTIRAGETLRVDGAASLTIAIQQSQNTGDGGIYAGDTSSTAILSGPQASVSGEVRTPGSVQLGANSSARGGIFPQSAPQTVPDIKIQSYSTLGYEGVTHMQPGTYVDHTTLTGPVYVNGDLNVQGELTFNNVILYLDGGGSLKADGDVHGTATIYATGGVSLRGNVRLVASDGIAVFSQGPLSMLSDASFQGLLYSHTRVTSGDGMHVYGAIVCNGTTDGSISLGNNNTITYVPEYARMLGNAAGNTQDGLHLSFWREL